MKAFLCVVVFVGAIAGGWAIHSRPSACEQVDAICSRPSISNLSNIMLCSAVAMARIGDEQNERKCARILAAMKK